MAGILVLFVEVFLILWFVGFSQVSRHASATMGVAMSLRDGSINLSNSWNRQLSATSNGSVRNFPT